MSKNPPVITSPRFVVTLLVLLCGWISALPAAAEKPANWWNPEWANRSQITLNTGDGGLPLESPPGSPAVLIRLAGEFDFAAAREDGSDLRFLAADHKTVLTSHIERWDSLLNEALVWVRVPDLPAGAATNIWLYSGNPAAEPASAPAATYDGDTVSVYHFSESAGIAADSSASAVNLEGSPIPVATALIGGGVRFTGQNSLTIPADPALAWTASGALTLSVWINPSAAAPGAVVYSRRSGDNAFMLGLDNGVPFVSVNNGQGAEKSSGTDAVNPGSWHHLAVTSQNGILTLYLDGEPHGSLNAPLPALDGPAILGLDSDPEAGVSGFAGEMDELVISKVVRSPGWIRFSAVNQGAGPGAAQLLAAAPAEASGGAAGHSEIMEHLSLIGDISKSLTIDGWIVIWCCGILAFVGWVVAIRKLLYLNRIAGSSKVFLQQWASISTDITALDHADEYSVRSMGGKTSRKDQRAMKESPLFHLYHLGSQEIQHRVHNSNGNFKGLSERSITSIRALLDGGATREIQRLQSKLVFLTIGIAGGPYLGLLGTVIGVMITFAVIAKSGEVEINSIAPGIAGALLATVAGLAVAIPALFAYSYLASRIKDAILGMNTFIDEFIARIAEAYPSND